MDAQSREEFKTYLTQNDGFPWGIRVEEGAGFRAFYDTPEARTTRIDFPKSAGEFAYLASSLAFQNVDEHCNWGGGTLVYDDWGVGDINGNLAGYQMVERIRSTFGELRPFHYAPVHRFREDERHLLTSFILAALVYGWDAYYIPTYEGWFAHISHDGYCAIATKRTEDFERFIQPKLDKPDSNYKVNERNYLRRVGKPPVVSNLQTEP